jgi:hypothetical protein
MNEICSIEKALIRTSIRKLVTKVLITQVNPESSQDLYQISRGVYITEFVYLIYRKPTSKNGYDNNYLSI